MRVRWNRWQKPYTPRPSLELVVFILFLFFFFHGRQEAEVHDMRAPVHASIVRPPFRKWTLLSFAWFTLHKWLAPGFSVHLIMLNKELKIYSIKTKTTAINITLIIHSRLVKFYNKHAAP